MSLAIKILHGTAKSKLLLVAIFCESIFNLVDALPGAEKSPLWPWMNFESVTDSNNLCGLTLEGLEGLEGYES